MLLQSHICFHFSRKIQYFINWGIYVHTIIIDLSHYQTKFFCNINDLSTSINTENGKKKFILYTNTYKFNSHFFICLDIGTYKTPYPFKSMYSKQKFILIGSEFKKKKNNTIKAIPR